MCYILHNVTTELRGRDPIIKRPQEFDMNGCIFLMSYLPTPHEKFLSSHDDLSLYPRVLRSDDLQVNDNNRSADSLTRVYLVQVD